MNDMRWRCFHCDAVFSEHQEKWAREHFGRDEGDMPVCQMRLPGESHLITALRRAQDELASYRSEDTDLMRAIESMEADYREKMRREEEKGYARGLKDYMAVEASRDELREQVTKLRAALEPLAVFGRPCKVSGTPNFHDLEEDVCVATNSGLAITAGDCRRAAEVFAATAPKEPAK